MLNRYGWQLYHWHIEPSSKCSLRCPRCPRQEHPDISWMQKEISLAEFKRVFTHDMLEQTQRFTMCGDVGDPMLVDSSSTLLSLQLLVEALQIALQRPRSCVERLGRV